MLGSPERRIFELRGHAGFLGDQQTLDPIAEASLKHVGLKKGYPRSKDQVSDTGPLASGVLMAGDQRQAGVKPTATEIVRPRVSALPFVLKGVIQRAKSIRGRGDAGVVQRLVRPGRAVPMKQPGLAVRPPRTHRLAEQPVATRHAEHIRRLVHPLRQCTNLICQLRRHFFVRVKGEDPGVSAAGGPELLLTGIAPPGLLQVNVCMLAGQCFGGVVRAGVDDDQLIRKRH